MNTQQILEQAVAMISRLMGELEAEAFEQGGFSDLSVRQMIYMDAITQLERPTFSELAEKLAITKPSVTAIVKKLNEMGYVQKVQSSEDLRVYHIVLTTKGEIFNEMHDKTHQLLASRLTQNLKGAEIEQLATLLNKIMDG